MKKKVHVLLTMLAFALVLSVGTPLTYAAEVTEPTVPTESTEVTDPVYQVTVSFDKNGGTSGTMADLTVTSDEQSVLPQNTFKRTGYQFVEWNTQADGKGIKYADKADVTALAAAEADGSVITLYAQWKLTVPEIKKVSATEPSFVKVTFPKLQSGYRYEIQSSASKTFSEKKTVKVTAANTKSVKVPRKEPYKACYLRMRVCSTTTTEKSDWSAVVKEKAFPVYQVNVVFNKNGGTGSMKAFKVKSSEQKKLPKNTLKRAGYQFVGWNTKKDGSGDAYKDKAVAAKLATAKMNGKKVTLYAQWQMAVPKIKKASAPNPSYIQVSFAKLQSGYGYEIQYSTSNKFSKKTTTTLLMTDKTATSAKLMRVTPNKRYYVRMRTYKKKDKSVQSEWSKVVSVKVKNGKTIANTKSAVAVEADVTLNGAGTGYHAKLVFGNPTSAVSFGIQYDTCAQAPYTGKAMALIENIASNDAGGQSYIRPGDVELQVGKTYHLMMTTDGNGNIDVYVDYKKIGSCYQPALKTLNFVRIESCARLNGDSVNAEFSNIKYQMGKGGAPMILGDNLGWDEYNLNPGLKYSWDKKKNSIFMDGTIYGINGDWDSDYEHVSEILQFKY